MMRSYLDGYLTEAGDAEFVPSSRGALDLLLEVSLLEKAVYELGYELSTRPSWVHLPLRALDDLTSRGAREPTG
jgi:maltose alpha-D-glucosyltransferase/alpha-amylase